MTHVHDLLVTVEHGGGTKDLVLSVDDDMVAAAMLAALGPRLGLADGTFTVHLARTGQRVDPYGSLAVHELRSGDRLTTVAHDGGWPSLTPAAESSWTARVVEGPRAGATLVIRSAETVLGRGDEGIDLGDKAVSRRHAVLHLGEGLHISDLGSRNGTYVNDREVGDERVALHNGDRIDVGDSVVVVEAPKLVVPIDGDEPDIVLSAGGRLNVDAGALGPGAHLTYEAGRLRFNRPPRVLHPEPRQRFKLESPPETPPKRRVPLASAFVPVLLGAVIFYVTKNALFLLFMAAGPIMAVWSFVDDRRSGRKDFKQKSADYRDLLTQTNHTVAGAQQAAVAWRKAQHPQPTEVVWMAEALSADLWPRRPGHPDFLDLRVGVADQPSLVQVDLDRRGDPSLLEEATEIASRFTTDAAVPVVVPLQALGVVGIAGHPHDTAGTARWLSAQLAAHQSPRDVAIAVLAPDHARSWDWVKWLPHVERLGDGFRTIAADDAETTALFGALSDLAAKRWEDQEQGIQTGARRYSPHVVVFVQPPLRLSPREMGEFLELAPRVGMSVVWVDEERTGLPGECRAIVEVLARGSRANITFTEGGYAIHGLLSDTLDAGSAEEVGRALAPLRDASAGGEGEDLPARIDLLDLFDQRPVDGEAVARLWQASASAGGLSGYAGVDEAGPRRIDLRGDGPHGLVAGTTGAGKSEFLQSFVAALALEHSPTRLNFVLVDYKGGAAFKDAKFLPHTVGFVTDLDAHLTQRALVSLNAELRRREAILAEHEAKDLLDLLARHPPAAPPSLLIVIDEFAALRTEVPEFVDGVVDIAQRGRSLGVHMILATQKPGGVITPAIQANTNLRVSLRVADRNESTDVIGKPDAAEIPRSLPGRGYLRTGPTEIHAFQAAFVGGASRTSSASATETAVAETFHFTQAERQALVAEARAGPDGPTDLQSIVRATREAAAQLGLPAPHRPWLEPLPEALPWSSLGLEPISVPGLAAVVGIADQPERQTQDREVLDLDALGHLLVYGGAGSGKTTLLRTIAASLAVTKRPDELHIYGLDFAGRGLGPLAALPHCGDVVFGDQIDRVRRLVSMLTALAAERKQAFGEVGAATLAEYMAATGRTVAYVVVLLDGFAPFWSVMEPLDRSQHVDAFNRLVAEGRAVGIHVVVTADRRGAVPPVVASTIAGRAVLRMASTDEYLNLGLPELAKAPPTVAGRAFFGTTEVQVAVVTDTEDSAGASQAAALQALGDGLQRRWGGGDAPPVRLLPDVVGLGELRTASQDRDRLVIGLEEATLEPAVVDLSSNPLLLVAGPDRSGRTNALTVLTRSLRAADPAIAAHLVASRRTSLLDDPGWSDTALGADDAAALTGRLASEIEQRALGGASSRLLVVVDDADDFVDGPVAAALERIVKRARDADVVVLVALSSFRAQRTFSAWVQALRNARQGLLLQPDLDDDGDILHIKLPKRAGLALPPGRGYLVQRGRAELVQVALP